MLFDSENEALEHLRKGIHNQIVKVKNPRINVYVSQVYLDHDNNDPTVMLVVDKEDIKKFTVGRKEITIRDVEDVPK